MRLNSRTLDQRESPISAAYALVDSLDDTTGPLDLAQASPPYPPAESVSDHVAQVARSVDGAGYTDVPGLPKLRRAVADELSAAYEGRIESDHVVITAGCNQAFSLVASVLANPGDEVIVPLPYYFNHDMWLWLNGIRPVYLEPGPDLVPRAETAATLLTARTRAIVLVTPGNPSGVVVDPAEIARFAALARRHGIALVLDETYRSFRDESAAAHVQFGDPGWTSTVVSLHSFSKDLALPGYRVGAIVASAELNQEVCKLLDCVAVCAPRIGQEAAWAGLTTAATWRAERFARAGALVADPLPGGRPPRP